MEDNKLEIYIFGGLELRYKDKVIGANVSKGRSRKMWTMGSNNNVGRFIGECVLSGGEGEER